MKLINTIVITALITVAYYPFGTDAFAAAKRKGRTNKIVVGKGFGASTQPPIEEVVAKFKTRLPPNSDDCTCPCGTGRAYSSCCKPFHKKDVLPASPLDVLRSRYTAFAWRLPLYIIDTTHPTCRDFKKDKVAWARDLDRDGMFDSYEFVALEIGSEELSESGVEGFVEFKVRMRANVDSGPHLEGQEIVLRERSRFLCSADHRGDDGNENSRRFWTYAGGDVKSDVAGLEDAILNG